MKKRSFFKNPNMLVKGDRLSFAFRKVGLVLFSYSNALGAKPQKDNRRNTIPRLRRSAAAQKASLLFAQLCVKKNGAYTIIPTQAANEATGADIRPSLRCILSSKEIICKTFLEIFSDGRF